MLRNTRTFVASSSRATAYAKASVTPLLKAPSRPINTVTATTSSSKPLKTLGPRVGLLIPRARYVTKAPNGLQQGIDPEEDKRIGQKKLEVHPESVTTESSVRHVYEPSTQGGQKEIKHGVRDDLAAVKETFALSDVPKEPYVLGLTGTLPYLGTSVSTIYLTWVLNTQWPTTSNFANHFLISHDTAHHLLSVLEPIQLGYGAIIISFLGAVHWGMEYTEKVADPKRTRFRYGLGVLASIIAWPTLFIPMDFALTAQFAAFSMLYFADARATVRGWAPSWYGSYRFVLTAVVGTAIVISLIGRMKVGDAKPRLTGLDEKLHDHRGEENYTKKWKDLETKEKKEAEKRKKEEEKEAKKKKAAEKNKSGKNEDTEKNKEDKKTEETGKENGSKEPEKTEQDDSGKEKGNEDKGEEEEKDEEENGNEKKSKDEGGRDEEGEEEKNEGDSQKEAGKKEKTQDEKPKKSKGGKKGENDKGNEK